MSIIFLTTTLYPMIAIAAVISIDGIQQSCSYQKAYGLAVKVLLVYGSHALTVKTKPGSGLLDSARDVLTALLCPGYASSRAFVDLCTGFNATGIKGCVNTESACLRINVTDFNKKRMIRAEGEKINARPLGAGETFVIIPRGKHHYFRGTGSPLFNRRSPMKASIAIVQLVFGIYQLAAASRASINKYGYGSYVFTIIPYAYSSLINGLTSIFTAQYSEVQELLLDETKGATLDDVFSEDAYDDSRWSGLHALITVVIYLTIIGASTHFHKRASTTAQRGWFVSWMIMGTFFYTLSRVPGSDDFQDKLFQWIFPIMMGVPTIGGFVSLSQQYLANFVCSSTS